MDLRAASVRLVAAPEEGRFRELMRPHHYLGKRPKIGRTLWYVATLGERWLALLGFSSSALKVSARDRWIGWDFRCQYDRLHLIASNCRFLVLPEARVPHLASRVLALCERRLRTDWPRQFGHPLWLLETFVDPNRFGVTCYRAAHWIEVGSSRGYRRVPGGFSATPEQPKRVFLRPLIADAAARLSQLDLDPSVRSQEAPTA